MIYAPNSKRFFAFMIDAFICVLIFHLTSKIIASIMDLPRLRIYWSLEHVRAYWIWAKSITDCFLIASYFFMCEGILTTSTIGKRLMKIQVVVFSGSHPTSTIALRTACKLAPFILYQYVVYKLIVDWQVSGSHNATMETLAALIQLLLIIYTAITYGMAFFNPKKQALHDKIAKTAVIQVA